MNPLRVCVSVPGKEGWTVCASGPQSRGASGWRLSVCYLEDVPLLVTGRDGPSSRQLRLTGVIRFIRLELPPNFDSEGVPRDEGAGPRPPSKTASTAAVRGSPRLKEVMNYCCNEKRKGSEALRLRKENQWHYLQGRTPGQENPLDDFSALRFGHLRRRRHCDLHTTPQGITSRTQLAGNTRLQQHPCVRFMLSERCSGTYCVSSSEGTLHSDHSESINTKRKCCVCKQVSVRDCRMNI